MTVRHASCSCGQLSAKVKDDPARVSICHCKACQKRTGSAFGVQARFPEERVSITGDSKRYTRTADSGDKAHFYFCPECGSTVFYQLDPVPDVIVIPVGAFADKDFPVPTFSVYEARQYPWVKIDAEMEHWD